MFNNLATIHPEKRRNIWVFSTSKIIRIRKRNRSQENNQPKGNSSTIINSIWSTLYEYQSLSRIYFLVSCFPFAKGSLLMYIFGGTFSSTPISFLGSSICPGTLFISLSISSWSVIQRTLSLIFYGENNFLGELALMVLNSSLSKEEFRSNFFTIFGIEQMSSLLAVFSWAINWLWAFSSSKCMEFTLDFINVLLNKSEISLSFPSTLLIAWGTFNKGDIKDSKSWIINWSIYVGVFSVLSSL